MHPHRIFLSPMLRIFLTPMLRIFLTPMLRIEIRFSQLLHSRTFCSLRDSGSCLRRRLKMCALA